MSYVTISAEVAVEVDDIDRINIYHATMLGMRLAVEGVRHACTLARIDGNAIPRMLPCPAEALIGGDASDRAIMAASILAKVTRDRHMVALHAQCVVGREVAVADQPVVLLPLGTARIVEIARALATQPRFILLDEPTTGLDVQETAQIAAALRVARDERGVAFVVVEHDVELVLEISSEITVLDFGKVIARGTPSEIRASTEVQAAYLGTATAEAGCCAAARCGRARLRPMRPVPARSTRASRRRERAAPMRNASSGLRRSGGETSITGTSAFG